ncbi:Probable serine/threonine-protein kinase SIS8 [Linum perenne]
MEETRDDSGSAEQGPSAAWWNSDFIEKFGSVSMHSQEDTLSNKESPRTYEEDSLSSQTASQVLWSTGMLSEPIPNGFYSVQPDKKLKEHFESLPTLDELHALGNEALRADVIVVDVKKDKKLSMLKQLIVTLVRGLSANPASMIKKIAGLVSDFYKRPSVDSPARTCAEESYHMLENRGVQLLGQIKHGSCRPRAILFKVLADTVGLESRLVVGVPNDGSVECADSYKHMSVIVVLNSMDLLVDLMRFPGQLIPRSSRAVFMTHISAAGESDSAENDSCDSPLEPNSPLYPDSSSHSEPNIAATFWRRSRKKVIAEQRTASSSPEHPSLRVRGRSMLSGDRHLIRDYPEDLASTRSEGASTSTSTSSETRRLRRRSMSMTPEIGDDIVRAVRAMSETLKQNRLMREQGDGTFSTVNSDNKDNSSLSSRKPALYALQVDHTNSQKAMSLPSSPHGYNSQALERYRPSGPSTSEEFVSMWNKVLESPMFQNKPLLPYDEWTIDFSEISVGTRVGIGFFGEVFRGVWNGTEVALKVFLEQDLTAENMEDFCNEISILSRLRHPNVSQLIHPVLAVILFLGACIKPPRLSMVTEYMEMGSLYYLIHMSGQKKKLSWRRRLKMLRDICRGLMCMHRMKIVHRDLKSANCLVNKHWTVKICDFGLSRIMVTKPVVDSSSAGTPEWMAPELIRSEPFTEKCDIFSLGVIMWELWTLNRPWEGIPPERVVYAVANEGSRLEIPEDCWAEPDRRPSCEEILTRLPDCEYTLYG